MIAGALFYYQGHWWYNRLLTRIRRLRQPKYLFGAIVGGLYFYWYFIRSLARGGRGAPIPLGHQELAQGIASLVLFIMVALAWILPYSRAALSFTEAEVAFLFPAPIGRKTLIHFKLLKSQAVILFSAILLTLIGRSWGGGHFIIRALGWWIVFATMNLHSLGSSFARTRLLDRGFSNWLRRLLVLAVLCCVVGGVIYWALVTLPPPQIEGRTDLDWLARYATDVLRSGPLPYVLFPFRLVVAPSFAANAAQFLLALGPALAVMALLYWWVIRSNVAFEEASVELSRKTAERLAAVRSGNWHAARKPKKAARSPFQLSPTGLPAIALLWKNLTSAGSLVTARVWLFLVWAVIFGGFLAHSLTSRTEGLGAGLAVCALMLAGFSLFWGPQMIRSDLRLDLPVTDVLKMFPMPGWQVVLGEVLAPAAILTAVQWLLLLVALILFPNHFDRLVTTPAQRFGFALASAIVLPCVDLIALIIPNAAVLFFPAWFQLGKDGPRGFETTGQQLILMFGQLLVLALSLAPAVALFTLIFFLTSPLFPMALRVLLGGAAAAVFLLVEAGFAIRLLGAVFERFDLSEENLAQG